MTMTGKIRYKVGPFDVSTTYMDRLGILILGVHKVERTEGAPAYFPIWKCNFWPYGQF